MLDSFARNEYPVPPPYSASNLEATMNLTPARRIELPLRMIPSPISNERCKGQSAKTDQPTAQLARREDRKHEHEPDDQTDKGEYRYKDYVAQSFG